MGQAAVRPAFVRLRHVLAWALAVMANGVLLTIILLVPRTPVHTPPLSVIELQLVVEAAPDPEPEPEVEPEIEPEIEPLDPPPDPEDATDPDSREATADQQQANARPTDDESLVNGSLAAGEPTGLAGYAIGALPESAALTGTPFVIREIFCLTSSEATREAGHCPDGPDPDGLSMLRYASEANLEAGQRAAIGHGLSPEQIRALFERDGLPLADLSGQPTLADTSQSPTSSADQMRDSLPPRHPDPAFRD
ncbi:hypothetical protein [Maricaulis sp.]|uniref:hypothetical protein n=1 Tax=Maricaulis sp. TaxID=1486257 RepID=UPI003A91A67D